MTKKVFFLLLLISTGFATFAGDLHLELGPSFMLKRPVSLSDDMSEFKGLGLEDLKIGAEVDVVYKFIQVGSIIDYKPGGTKGDQRSPAAIDALVTAGLLLDFNLIRVGAGIGPSLTFDLNEKKSTQNRESNDRKKQPGEVGAGLGVRINADIVLGPIVVRANAISNFDMLRMSIAEDALEYLDLRTGLSVLLML